jgi:hypothetical protein
MLTAFFDVFHIQAFTVWQELHQKMQDVLLPISLQG